MTYWTPKNSAVSTRCSTVTPRWPKSGTNGAVLRVAVVKKPARTPEWQELTLKDAAQVRAFVTDLKRKLTQWSDRDD